MMILNKKEMAWITSENGNIDTFGSDLATPKPFPKINRKAPSLDMKQFASGKTSVDENRKRILATEYVYVDGKTLPVSESACPSIFSLTGIKKNNIAFFLP